MKFLIGIGVGFVLGVMLTGHGEMIDLHKSAKLESSAQARQLTHQAVTAAKSATGQIIAAASAEMNGQK